MAQDPDREDEQQGETELLTSHALDMVTLWSSGAMSRNRSGHDPGSTGVNGIPVMVVGASQYPNLRLR